MLSKHVAVKQQHSRTSKPSTYLEGSVLIYHTTCNALAFIDFPTGRHFILFKPSSCSQSLSSTWHMKGNKLLFMDSINEVNNYLIN